MDERARFTTEARRNLQETLPRLRLCRRSRAQALYHYCAVLEVEAFKSRGGFAGVFGASRAAVESSNYAIPLIFQECAPASDRSPEPLAIDRSAFADACDLFEWCKKYEWVSHAFGLADKGQYLIEALPEHRRIKFTYADPEADAADTLLRSEEIDASMVGSSQDQVEACSGAADSVRRCLAAETIFTAADSISYQYSNELLGRVGEWARHLAAAVSWELPADLLIGHIRYSQFQRFWGALVAMCNTHDLAHLAASQGDPNTWPIGSIVHLRSRDEWIRLLSELAGLSPESVSEIVGWFTYDGRVAVETPAVQPFIAATAGILIVPWLFVASNAAERNFVKLLNHHPRLRPYREAVTAAKEPLALAQLAALFPEPGFLTRDTVAVAKITDADLVILEKASGFVLIIQHKWLLAPETQNESSANDEQIKNGEKQSLDARDYWRRDAEALRSILGLKSVASIDRIEAAVVCRGAASTGFLGQLAVPVLTEPAFRALALRAPRLPALWELMNQRPDLKDVAKAFVDGTSTMELEGYEFIFPTLSIRARR